MNRLTTTALSLVICALPSFAPAQALTEDRVRDLVLETIRQNPDVVAEAISILREREQKAQAEAAQGVLSENREALENDPNAVVLGNPDGDVTIVEFFDYNCGYCRKAFMDIAELVKSDDQIKVVMREWPILGEPSEFAARASLASRAQDKYGDFHMAMMHHKGRLSEDTVMEVANEVGLDTDKLREDMKAPEVQSHIDTSRELTQALKVQGTPAFVFADQIVPGIITLEQMQELVKKARDAK